MAIPGNGSVLTTASIYQLTAPGSVNAQSTLSTALAAITTAVGLGSPVYIAEPLSTSSSVTFATTTTNGVPTETITYPDASSPTGTTTIPNVTLTSQGSTGFTFSSANGGTYYLSNSPIGGTAVGVNQSTNIVVSGLASTLDAVVGPNPTVYVGATNTPDLLNGQAYVACFLRGTLIATPHGEVPVETLRIGTIVLTGSGDAKPVLWVGRRSYATAFVGRNPKLVPVRIAAGALDENRPRRDLLLSPCHAIFVDGMLVPAGELVNGSSVTQAHGLSAIDYFHVEIEGHDVIFAESVPCETFVDHDSRMAFQNVDEYFALYPDHEEDSPIFYAPRIVDGPALERVRGRLAARATSNDLQRVA